MGTLSLGPVSLEIESALQFTYGCILSSALINSLCLGKRGALFLIFAALQIVSCIGTIVQMFSLDSWNHELVIAIIQDPNDNSMLDMLIGYSCIQIRILLLLLLLT